MSGARSSILHVQGAVENRLRLLPELWGLAGERKVQATLKLYWTPCVWSLVSLFSPFCKWWRNFFGFENPTGPAEEIGLRQVASQGSELESWNLSLFLSQDARFYCAVWACFAQAQDFPRERQKLLEGPCHSLMSESLCEVGGVSPVQMLLWAWRRLCHQ